MAVLIVSLHVEPADSGRLQARCFSHSFEHAIERQPGFQAVTLLQSDRPEQWFLLIEFDSEERRIAWVGTEEHAKAWPRIAELCRVVDATVCHRVPSTD